MRKHSVQTEQVFQALLDAPGETYGFELVKATGLPSGTVYPIMRRLEKRGFVNSRLELLDPAASRPRYRVFYELTADGRRAARDATAQKSTVLRTLNVGFG